MLTALIALCGFPVPGSSPCRTRLLAHSTAMIIMVVHMEIVGMHPWSWVLRLLLLLLLRGFVASATCVAKLAICDVTALRLRARASRSRQKTPEACTESVTRAFFRASYAG